MTVTNYFHCVSMAAVVANSLPKSRVSKRLAAIAESATLAVDSKAKALQAKGEHVIGFGAGEPDFPTPEYIVEAAVRAARDPKAHRYTPAAGLPQLREAIAAKTKRDSGFECTASQVLVTVGGKYAVFVAFAALCDPGDEVICPAPYWTTYPEAIALAGGVPVVIDTTQETEFKVTVEQLERAKTPKTKVLLFVSPDNPSGAVYSREETIAIGKWAAANDIWVVTDEIYEHLTYGKHVFSSMPTLVPEIADRCVIVNGVAKTYAMTGWRVGPRHTLSINTNTPAQFAALAALTGPQDAVQAMLEEYAERRTYLMGALSEMGMSFGHPGGAFYIYTNVSSTGLPSPRFCEELLRQGRVMIFPGSMFGDDSDKYVRISYLQPLSRIKEAVDRMRGFIRTR